MAYTSNIALEVQQAELASMSEEERREYELWLAGPESEDEEDEE
jgi:hypothetical protein